VGIAVLLAGYIAWGFLPEPPQDAPLIGRADPPAVLTAEEELKLLRAFQPVFSLAPGEEWRPIPIGAYLREATLEQRDDAGRWRAAARGNPPDPDTLPLGDGYRLNIPCNPRYGVDCYETSAEALRAVPPAVYGRIWRNESELDRDTDYIAQYFVFYYFDDWRNGQLEPTIWQFHEADWEHVIVALDRERKPRWAGYSLHCTGRVRDWEDVALDTDGHPRVFVALGSHANLFAPGSSRIPDDCLPRAARPLVNLFHFQDRAGVASNIGPGAQLIPFPIAARWLAFAGRWGEPEWMRYLDRRGNVHVIAGGHGVGGPARKTWPWRSPVEARTRWPEDPRLPD
jgi:hypothetical protein